MATETQTPRIGLIWAQAVGRVIGRDGDMPWHLPEDLKHFKRETLGAPVVMGRKTWDSLPDRFKPLVGRANIVITRDPNWARDGVLVAHSLDEALALAQQSLEPDLEARVDVWVIGGGAIFDEAIENAHELVVTKIMLEVEGGDAFAPEIDSSWSLVDAGELRESSSGLIYRIERYRRD